MINKLIIIIFITHELMNRIYLYYYWECYLFNWWWRSAFRLTVIVFLCNPINFILWSSSYLRLFYRRRKRRTVATFTTISYYIYEKNINRSEIPAYLFKTFTFNTCTKKVIKLNVYITFHWIFPLLTNVCCINKLRTKKPSRCNSNSIIIKKNVYF